jgi:hypothetical protein
LHGGSKLSLTRQGRRKITVEVNWGIAIISLVVGALLGGIVQAATGRYAAFRESQGIAEAVRSEIETILDLINQRGYLNYLNTTIQRLQNPAYQPTYQDLFVVRISQDYFTVFNSVSPKIGLLGNTAGRITHFYSLAKAVIEDLHDLREMRDAVMKGLITVLRQGLLTQYSEMVRLLQMMQDDGTIAIRGLRHHSIQWFLWREKFSE